MFWLRNKKNNFSLHTLIWRPARHHQNIVKPVSTLKGPLKYREKTKVLQAGGSLMLVQSTEKPVLSDHSKIDITKVFKTNGSLMKVKVLQNALLEHSAILWPALSDNRS